ncbi:phage major capsid protein [Leuconostoc pseudomesenteroides]|uniref:phage major capsid protein n=1 Tax=Leuconostoc pseudomesenteroides TaxID=33968 RepID=UPI0021A6B6CF|nr:phage major capsid protein [Leuconostoc pseudomesenteroides]MCT4380608.1 phage major capsid protein [Leuconostoc pseudomesenteroides]
MSDTLTQTVEIRAKTDEKRHLLSGYAIVFNSPSENMGFIEAVDPHALDDVDLSSTFALYNHNFNNVLGKTGKNLTLNVDEKGLSFSLELLPSDEHIFELVKDGIINKMSFGFIVDKDDWQDSKHRTILKIKELQEISLVPVPAYEGTDITAKRSLKMAEKTEDTQEETQPDLQAELDALKAEVEALKAGDSSSEDSQDDSEEQTVSADDKADDVEDKENTPKGEKKNMQTFNKAQDTESTEVRNFNAYLEGKVEKRDLTTVNGAPIIPQELLAEQYQPQASTGVLSLINTVSVDSNNVTLPVVKHATKGFTEVSAENADTASVDAPAIQEVNFDLKLYSGALPMSYQLAHSSKSAQRVILQHITAMRDLTRLQKVGALLKTATPKAVTDIDGIKDVYNADSFVNYPDANKSFIMTAELFAELDKAKDTTGAYILQPLATDATKRSIGGYPVEVVSSDVLGAGKVAFFGDAKAFIVEAINENMIFTYQENRNLSTVAVGGVFFDTKVADSDAGVFITFGAPAAK